MVASDIEDDNDMSMPFLLDGFCACCALYFDATFWIVAVILIFVEPFFAVDVVLIWTNCITALAIL